METMEQKRADAWKFVNCHVKANKLAEKKFSSLEDSGICTLRSDINRHVQMHGIIELCYLIDMPFLREDWDGNKYCDSNWDIIWFEYRGVRFFELVDKEEKNDERE